MDVTLFPASADRFGDVARLLAPKDPTTPACWCLTYRLSNAENSRLQAAERSQRMLTLCHDNPAPAIIAYVDGVPAGWCSFGPRTGMHRLTHSRTIPTLDDTSVWSVICFVVRAPYRRRGLARTLLEGVVAYASEQGAPMLEGYPIDTGLHRAPASAAFVGTLRLFESVGFERAADTSARAGGFDRVVVRLDLRGPGLDTAHAANNNGTNKSR